MDLALEFEGKKRDITIQLSQAAALGIDTTMLQQEFLDIEKKYSNYQDSNSPLTVNTIENHYIDGNLELDELGDKINEVCQGCLEIAKNCDAISRQRREEEPNLEQLSSLAIDTMEKLQTSSTGSYASQRKRVEEVYDHAYHIIKRELKKNGTSKVLDYVKENSIARSFINYRVYQEIESFKENVRKPLDSYPLEMVNGKIDYLQEDFLLLLINLMDPHYKEELLNKMTDLQSDYESYRTKVKAAFDDAQRENWHLKTKKQRKLKIFKRTCAAVLSSAIIIGTAVFGSAFFSKEYKTTTELFDSRTGQVEESSSYQNRLRIGESTERVYGDVFYKAGQGYHRTVWDYKLKDGVDPNSIDFSSDMSDLFEDDYSKTWEINVGPGQAGDKPYLQVIKITKDLEDFRYHDDLQLAVLVVTVAAAALIDLCWMAESKNGDSLLFGSIAEIIAGLMLLKDEKHFNEKELLHRLKKLNILLKENEEFRIRYESLYRQYSALVQNQTKKIDFDDMESYQVDALELPKKIALTLENLSEDDLETETARIKIIRVTQQ